MSGRMNGLQHWSWWTPDKIDLLVDYLEPEPTPTVRTLGYAETLDPETLGLEADLYDVFKETHPRD